MVTAEQGGRSAVTRRAERRSVTAETVIRAEPAVLFDLLTDVSQHALIDGSGMVIGDGVGPPRLALGSEFTMGMQQYGRGYRSLSRVVEFEEDRRIAWESMGTWRGHKIVGGQRWRWTLTPSAAGTTVAHSYLWGYARWPLLTVCLPKYPARAGATLPRSLHRLAILAAFDEREQ